MKAESKLTSRKLIALKLKEVYDHHEYAIKQDNFDKTVLNISELIDDQKHIDDFFKRVSLGEYGVLYRMPTCIMSMLKKYVDTRQIRKKDEKQITYEQMYNPNWEKKWMPED